MPWLFNPTRDVIQVDLLDGSSCGFLPRKRVYVDPSNMSAAAWRLVQTGQLANQGGDPIPVALVEAPAAPAAQVVAELVHPEKPDTSSSHHHTDGRVAVDSSNASSGEKESKAVKKQDDDLEKAALGGPSATQGNDTSKKTEKRSGGSRKRS